LQENAKALYRRGLARSRLGQLDESKQDLVAAAKLEPNNKDIRREIQVVKEKLENSNKKLKAAFGGLFHKVGRSTSLHGDDIGLEKEGGRREGKN